MDEAVSSFSMTDFQALLREFNGTVTLTPEQAELVRLEAFKQTQVPQSPNRKQRRMFNRARTKAKNG